MRTDACQSIPPAAGPPSPSGKAGAGSSPAEGWTRMILNGRGLRMLGSGAAGDSIEPRVCVAGRIERAFKPVCGSKIPRLRYSSLNPQAIAWERVSIILPASKGYDLGAATLLVVILTAGNCIGLAQSNVESEGLQRLIKLNVAVTNAKGEPVTDLKATEIHIREDGRPAASGLFPLRRQQAPDRRAAAGRIR